MIFHPVHRSCVPWNILSVVLTILMLLSVLPASWVCWAAEAAADAKALDSPPETFDIGALHLQSPFWSSETIYREGLFFIQDSPDRLPAARLLFTPVEVISLHSATGETVYEQGRDYLVQAASRQIVLPKNSRIPFIQRENLYRKPGSPHAIRHKQGDPETLLYFGEGRFFHDQQAEITYRQTGELWRGFIPKPAAENLPGTLAKLKAGEPLRICLTGDSIAAGGNASGPRGAPPHLPAFGELFALGLQQAYGVKVEMKNLAVGGKTADYGLQTADDIAAAKPDLVLIAYGMNDVHRRNPALYRDAIQKTIDHVRESNPNVEFILVSPMLANPEWQNTPAEMFPQYRDALASLCGKGAALADVTALWTDLLKRKGYYDVTGNGVNHANDYGHRLYAQVLLGLLVEK